MRFSFNRDGKMRMVERGIAGKKGATLIELVVVFAVLAIISTIVISFILMSNENVKASRDKVDALNDIAVVESIVESWVENGTKDGGKFVQEAENNSSLAMTKLLGSTYVYELSFSNDNLVETITNNGVTSHPRVLYTSVAIKDVSFDCVVIPNGETIVYCYITYGKNDYVYTFTVYPYNFIGTEEEQ